MLDRRTLILAGASTFAHMGKTVVVPTVSESLSGVLDTTNVPAMGYAVIGPKGVLVMEVAGKRRSDAADLVSQDDAWHIGSNTEAFTSALYARYVESGQAAWGASLAALFPDLKVDAAWAGVSIDDVLAHRGGVSDVGLIDEGWLIRTHHDKRPLPQQRTEMVARILSRPPVGKPKDYEYANADYVIAGAAIERIAHTSWENAVTAGVFLPLDMNSAGFGAPLGDEPWGHEIGPDGQTSPVDPKGVADNPSVLAPGGQAHLSLPDYVKFIQVFLNNGASPGSGSFLTAASLMKIARPRDAFAEGDGLGWRVTPNAGWAKGPVLAHEGSNTLWRALVDIAPARPLAIAIVTNCGGEPGARAAQMMSARLISEQLKDE
jgi:CubicO group peptidase (beta-lactamase class C family)